MWNPLTHRGIRQPALVCGLTLVITLAAACANSASPSAGGSVGGETSAGPSTEASAAPSEVAVIRCAKTPDAVPVATVKWNKPVEGSPTIKAGEAVAFITTLPMRPTVTEGVNGVAVRHACIDQTLIEGKAVIVTFYEPGEYHLFCRKDPTTMLTVVLVQ